MARMKKYFIQRQIAVMNVLGNSCGIPSGQIPTNHTDNPSAQKKQSYSKLGASEYGNKPPPENTTLRQRGVAPTKYKGGRPRSTRGLEAQRFEKLQQLAQNLDEKKIKRCDVYSLLDDIFNTCLLPSADSEGIPPEFITAINRRKLAFALTGFITRKEKGLFREASQKNLLDTQWGIFNTSILQEKTLMEPHLLCGLLKKSIKEKTVISQHDIEKLNKEISCLSEKKPTHDIALSAEESKTLKTQFFNAYNNMSPDEKDNLKVYWQVMKCAFDIAPTDSWVANTEQRLTKEGLAKLFAPNLCEGLSLRQPNKSIEAAVKHVNSIIRLTYVLLAEENLFDPPV